MQKTADQIALATRVLSSFVTHNSVPRSELPKLLEQVHSAIERLSSGEAVTPSKELSPAVAPSKSVLDDHIICLEDGLKFRMLKGHLHSCHHLTPDQYRRKWGLPANYPIVAPSYSKTRSRMAKRAGLGRVREG